MKDDGGPAFPSSTEVDSFRGMTLRDYFAARAIEAMVTGFYTRIGGAEALSEEKTYKALVSVAYWIADAMLEERAK